MELLEIVMRLNGPIIPVGESNADANRLRNIKSLTELVDELLTEIKRVTPAANRPEASMRAIGEHAKGFIGELKDV